MPNALAPRTVSRRRRQHPGPVAAGMSGRPGRDGPRRPKAKNVLVILEQGGLSHIDTWDPKPEVVAEHRSPYQADRHERARHPVHRTAAATRRRSPTSSPSSVRCITQRGRRRRASERHAVRPLRRRIPPSPIEMPDIGSRRRRSCIGTRLPSSAAVHHGAGQPRAGERDADRLSAGVLRRSSRPAAATSPTRLEGRRLARPRRRTPTRDSPSAAALLGSLDRRFSGGGNASARRHGSLLRTGVRHARPAPT